MKLSKRLQAVADCVPQGARVADIGSDHAKIPLWLVENAVSDYIIAGEVVVGPYQIAQEATENFPQIEVRLADGLAAVKAEDKIDSVIIAGMGGVLISEILSRGNLSGISHLILQANNEEAELRRWLMDHAWQMTYADILEDKGKIYELIVVEPGDGQLTAEEIQFGTFSGPIFEKKWQKRLAEIDKILQVVAIESDKRAALTTEKEQIEEVLHNRGGILNANS